MITSRKFRIAAALSTAALATILLTSVASSAQAVQDMPISMDWEGGFAGGGGSGAFPINNGTTPRGEVPPHMQNDFRAVGEYNGVFVYKPTDAASGVTQGAVDAFNQAKNAGAPLCAPSSDNSAITCPN